MADNNNVVSRCTDVQEVAKQVRVPGCVSHWRPGSGQCQSSWENVDWGQGHATRSAPASRWRSTPSVDVDATRSSMTNVFSVLTMFGDRSLVSVSVGMSR